MRNQSLVGAALLSLLASYPVTSETKARARDLGVALDGTPGPFNAITDVPGVEVGYTTLIEGEGKRTVGKGPVRTGVTAILPRGHGSFDSVFAAFFAGNGNGDMTALTGSRKAGCSRLPSSSPTL